MSEPWYRHRWPWLLIAGPAIVVLAGLATLWIAIESADGLVADDYYKQGMAINKRMAREETAQRLGISATVALQPHRIQVELSGQSPEALFVQLVHATRAGYDVRLRLAPVAPGRYEAQLDRLPPGRWRVVIEDPRGTWRIAQEAS
jgi:hypothetical protein